jgi:hypothetical protein
MSDRHQLLGATLALATLTACEAKPDAAPSPTSAAPAASVAAAAPPPAQAALDAMDARKPVPLLPMMANHQKQNMRDHLVAVQEIIAALGTQDFAAIEKSAGRIGYSEQMGQMCTHMGAGADGFTDQALAFHHTADEIGEAAKRKDADGVLKALNETLSACTSCHATYKQAVVDEATWTATTKMAPPMHSP